MANIRTCNKHNMIACVEKTAHNADFYQIIDYLTGCSINYSLLVDPDLIGPWLQQFWATASLRVINEVPHIRATVAGKKVLISEETIRADLLFDDADGVDCFPKQVIWDSLRDIGYEGNLAQLTFSKPLFSPQWKYLVHVLLHCLSPKSTSWEQFGTNIASALVGLATNQKFNFSLMILNGMLGHISNGTPFLMYPRFIQLFLNKQLEGVTRPQNFLPSVTLPSKVFTFMRKHSPKFSCRITPLTPPMLEVVTALAAEEAHSTSSHSRAETSPRDAQGTPIQSAAQTSISTAEGTVDLQDTAERNRNDDAQRQVVKHHAFLVESLESSEEKEQRKKQKKKVSSVKLGRNKDEGTLSEEHYVQEDYTADHFLKYYGKRASDVKSGDTEELDLETFKVLLGKVGPRDKGKGILVEEPKKKKLTLQQIRALETTNDEEVARKIQVTLGCSRRRKKRKRKAAISEKSLSKKLKMWSKNNDALENYLRIVDFEQNAQDRESLEAISVITEVSKSLTHPMERILFHYIELYKISEQSLQLNQEDWEIIRWRLNESSGVHTLELEDGTMIHMLAEKKYPLSRELMIRMLDHGMEVEDENEIAITLIHLFILWTTKDGDDS
ncbi:hypothetical protein Tco_1210222 [Tanacetum coccineum]